VRTLFPSHGVTELSPFLLLDYAGPARFEPSNRPRGVEEHPHRGFVGHNSAIVLLRGEVVANGSSTLKG
jgi:hypothetical protein